MTYKVQIDDEVRDATQSEAAHIEQIRADAKTAAQTETEIAAAKVSARVKLKALGLTDDEIAALAG